MKLLTRQEYNLILRSLDKYDVFMTKRDKEIRLLGAKIILLQLLITLLKIVLFIYTAIILPHTIMLIKSYLYLMEVGKVTPLRAD